jgi:uncharacterized protein YjbI with pentapeptide repeats
MIGLHFEHCNPILLSLSFEHCALNLASFYQLQLKNIVFDTCNLNDVDFAETNLSHARFEGCDLNNAIFEKTNLEHADLSAATNFKIDPEQNRLTKARFSINGVVGLLGKYDIVVV